MSKENTAGKPEDNQEEEFVIVEVDEKGKPIAQAEETDDDDADDDGADDGADDVDERVGHSEDDDEDEGAHAGETPDERRERRRRENRAKRVRNRVAAESKDRLIQNQGRMLLNLQEQVAKLEGRTVRYDTNLLQNQLQQIESQQTDAKAVLAKLSKAGDHEGIAEVVEVQMNLRDQHRTITEQLRRAKAGKKNGRAEADETDDGEEAAPAQRRPAAPAPDPEVVRRAVTWAGKHAFADPKRGNPEEIEIVKAIDHNLHKEGWDPRSDDYWAELTSRVKRRLPHHFKKAAPNGDGRQNGGRRVQDDKGGRPANGGPRMAPASQSGGGSRPLGKNEVRVTPDRKKAMQEAGMWDDPKKRNRMLAQYAKYDRESVEQQ